MSCRELNLNELLADPIVRQMMARDGATEQEVRAIARSAQRRITERREEHRFSALEALSLLSPPRHLHSRGD